MKDDIKTLPPEEKLLRAIFGERWERTRCRSEVNGVTLKQAIEAALSTLAPRQIELIRTRFGFDDPLGKGRTLEDTGKAFGITRGRIRHIEAKCLRLLRHPSRSLQRVFQREITENRSCPSFAVSSFPCGYISFG